MGSPRVHILDVRTWPEFCSGYLQGAYHIPTPLPPLSKEDLKTLENELLYFIFRYTRPGDNIYIYCKLGKRAAIAQKILQKHGIKSRVLGGVEVPPLKSFFEEGSPLINFC